MASPNMQHHVIIVKIFKYNLMSKRHSSKRIIQRRKKENSVARFAFLLRGISHYDPSHDPSPFSSFISIRFQVYSNDNLWIGYNDRENEGDWTWTDRMTSSYTNWDEASPNNGGVSCALVSSPGGSWRDESCKKKHDFICKKCK